MLVPTARLRGRSLLLSIAVAGALAGGVAPAAHATTVLTCGGAQNATFTPALTDTPQMVSISSQFQYGPCVNATNPLELRTGTASSTSPPALRACGTLAGSRSGTRVIHWSTGTTSTWSFILTTNSTGLGVYVSTLQGSITAGEFQGATATGVTAHATLSPLACSTTGSTGNGGPTSIVLVQ